MDRWNETDYNMTIMEQGFSPFLFSNRNEQMQIYFHNIRKEQKLMKLPSDG